MINVFGPVSSGTTAGSAGSAAATGDSSVPISGNVMAVYVKFNGTHAATTDVTVKTKGTNAPSQNILVLSNVNTSGWYYPRVQIHDGVGGAIADQYDWLPINDYISVVVAQGDPNLSVEVTLYLD